MPYYPTADMFQTTAIVGLWLVIAGFVTVLSL